MSDCWIITDNDFQDELVLQIIECYGKTGERTFVLADQATHGSTISSSKGRCQYFKLTGQSLKMYWNTWTAPTHQYYAKPQSEMVTPSTGYVFSYYWLHRKLPPSFLCLEIVQHMNQVLSPWEWLVLLA